MGRRKLIVAKESNNYCLRNIALAVLVMFLFMAGVRVAVEKFYPDGNENLARGDIVIRSAQAGR